MEAFDPRKGKANIRCDLVKCGCKKIALISISHRYKYIYFGIPKCASTSIRNSLPDKENIRTDERLKTMLTDEVYNEYFKFTFVRNPWDRMVSNYSMFVKKKQRSRDYTPRLQIEELFQKPRRSISFAEFIHKAQSVKNHHWSQCCEWLPRDSDGCLDIDFIGRVENFDDDFQKLLTLLKIDINKYRSEMAALLRKKRKASINKEIVHFNKTNHKDYKLYYSNKEKQIIAKLFADDIKIFQFKFD